MTNDKKNEELAMGFFLFDYSHASVGSVTRICL